MPDLSGLTVLVTRPAHQAQHLQQLLQAAGAHALLFPTIEIVASSSCKMGLLQQNKLSDYDIALFVSQNAVDYAFDLIDKTNLPAQLKLGVIGKGSLSRLQQLGLAEHAIPADTYNSEGLLATPLLQQVAGKKVLIFRGQAGRNLLGDTLQQRGAYVDYCEVYRRQVPSITDTFYQSTFKHNIDLAIFTSSEGLLKGFELFKTEQKEQLLQTPWLLISERMKKTAYNLEHSSDLIIAHQASDEGMMSAILEWKSN